MKVQISTSAQKLLILALKMMTKCRDIDSKL
jgi:hypothetical protein